MPADKYFVIPFAESGTVSPVPDTIPGDGSVSYPSGFGPDYAKPLGGVSPDPTALPMNRAQFNQIMNDVTGAIQQYQQLGIPNFISTLANLGTPFPYEAGAYARYDAGSGPQNWISLVDANIVLPGSDPTKWALVNENNLSDEQLITLIEASNGGVADLTVTNETSKAVANVVSRQTLAAADPAGLAYIGAFTSGGVNGIYPDALFDGNWFSVYFTGSTNTNTSPTFGITGIPSSTYPIKRADGSDLYVGELKNASVSFGACYQMRFNNYQTGGTPYWVLAVDELAAGMGQIRTAVTSLGTNYLENLVTAGAGINLSLVGPTGTPQSVEISATYTSNKQIFQNTTQYASSNYTTPLTLFAPITLTHNLPGNSSFEIDFNVLQCILVGDSAANFASGLYKITDSIDGDFINAQSAILISGGHVQEYRSVGIKVFLSPQPNGTTRTLTVTAQSYLNLVWSPSGPGNDIYLPTQKALCSLTVEQY